jgi:hypothetical protein
MQERQLTDDLGDKSPHGDGVGEREDAEDDVVPPPDGLEGFRADLTDHKVYTSERTRGTGISQDPRTNHPSLTGL